MTLRQYIIQEFGSMDEYMKFLQDWSTTCAEPNRRVDNPNWMKARRWAKK